MTSYYCQHLYNLYTFLSQKLFAVALIWFFVAEISWSKGKNNFEWSAVSLSLSRSHPVTDSSMLVTRVLVSDERRQRFFFFFSTSTRRDVRISREKLGHSVFFFRNGGRHSRFSSAFNVTFDLSYLASHLSYRLQTKCILKWKSFVVKRMLKNDISVKIDTIPRVSKFREIIIFAWLEWILWRIINHVNLPAKRDKTENKTEGTENY